MNQLTSIFKLLSDETRLRMLVLLYQDDLCVCELGGILDAPQPRISKNLSKLRDLDLVISQRNEKFVFYRLKKENVILVNTLEAIIANLDYYPELIEDQSRLQEKAMYSSQCCTFNE
jgi:ArsR family transcriptional regulator